MGRRDAHDGVAERRLAHPVAPDEGDGLVADLEADVLQHVRAAVVDVEVLDGQQRRAAVRGLRARGLLARGHPLTSMPSSVTRPPRYSSWTRSLARISSGVPSDDLAPVVHHRDALGHAQSDVHVVLDEDQRDACIELEQQVGQRHALAARET